MQYLFLYMHDASGEPGFTAVWILNKHSHHSHGTPCRMLATPLANMFSSATIFHVLELSSHVDYERKYSNDKLIAEMSDLQIPGSC